MAVEHRDGGCRVPGCERRYVHLHHIRRYADGGVSETDNLICLCPHHHRLHHQGRLRIQGTDADDPEGITFGTDAGPIRAGVGPPLPGTGPPPPADSYRHPSGERLQGKWVTPSRSRASAA